MTRRQLAIVYGILLFVLCWGAELLRYARSGGGFDPAELLNPFLLTQLAYGGGAMLAMHFVLRRWLRRPVVLVLAILSLFAVFILFRYSLEELLMPALTGYRNYNQNTPLLFYAFDNIYYAAVYLLMGAFIYFIDEAVGGRKRQQELAEKGREAELAFLRMQVNPHFLFNSLNNIYALSYKSSPKAPEAILKLSELMRYMLYEKKELLPLTREWEYLRHFLGLQELRYEHSPELRLSAGGDIESWELPSYLLIAFVENAFKHGDFAPGKPLEIGLHAGPEQLVFRVRNTIGRHHKDSGGGIGLGNVRRRLELLYPGRHKLETTISEGYFIVNLQITRRL